MKYIRLGLCLAFSVLLQGLAEAQTVNRGESATFRAKSLTAQSFEWTFPGNVIINGAVVQFTFNEPGPQEVKLKVTGFDNNSNEITKRVLVANKGRPTAVIEATVDGKEILGSAVEASLNQDISLTSNSFFEDKTDEAFAKVWTVNGRNYNGSEVSKAFDAIGNYQVVLTVQDPASLQLKDQDQLQVRIINQAPTVTGLSAVASSEFIGQVLLTAQAEDADGDITSYKFEALEGGRTVLAQVVNANSTVLDLSRFAGSHDYTFRVTVTDDRFAVADFTNTDGLSIDTTESNQVPTAKIGVTPGNQGRLGEVFSFAAAAEDPDNDQLKFEWILSSGQRFFTPEFKTTFNRVGSYDVQLNVSDGLEKVSDKLSIIIEEPETVVLENNAPTVKINGVLPSQKGLTSTVFRLYVTADDSDLDRLSYVWDFGNGTQSFTKNAAVIFQEPGTYNVNVSVSDGIETVTDSTSLTVELGPNGEGFESVEDRIVRLQEEALEAERLALEAQGELSEKQKTLVEGVDAELLELIKASTNENDEAREAAEEKLNIYRESLAAGLETLEEAKKLDESVEDLLQRLSDEQRASEQKSLEILNTDKTERAARLTTQLDDLSTTIGVLEEAKASNETLEQAATRLQNQQQNLAQQSQDLRAQGLTAESARVEAYRNDVQAAVSALEEAQKNGESLEAAALKLSQQQQTLKQEAEVFRQQNRDQEAERLEQRQASLKQTIKTLKQAQADGETLEEAAVRLQNQAALAQADSQKFNDVSKALNAERLVERQDFLQTQVETLETLREQPVELPPLGITRNGQETLEERLERLSNQSEKAALEAKQRQKVAADIAAVEQAAKLEQLTDLQNQLDNEQDENKQTILKSRIEALETEIEMLGTIVNPGQALTAVEIRARTEALVKEEEERRAEVIAGQQEYIASRLAEIQSKIDLASDGAQKSALETEKKQLESDLAQTGIVVGYESQLVESRKALNQRLGGDLNATARLLVNTQLDSIEGKLSNLEALQSAEAAQTDFAATVALDPIKAANKYLETETSRLEAELAQIRTDIASTDDEITKKALSLRESEILEALKRLPQTVKKNVSVDTILTSKALDYLEHYKGALANKKESETLKKVNEHLALLRRLDNSGYTPQTKLSALLLDLERREKELLTDYRNTEDAGELASLKNKLIILGEARDQLSSLERYGVELNDSAFTATEKLQAADFTAKEAYLNAASEAEKIVATQAIGQLEKSEKWLSRFYNPERRAATIASLERDLLAHATGGNHGQTAEDLAELKILKLTLKDAIESQIQADFENFKTNLKRQALQVNDEAEKAALEERIEALSYQDFAAGISSENTDFFGALLADLTITTNTNLFLYADTPLDEVGQPLLFEWNMGDGENRFGQNVEHAYYEPGFYRVVLTVSDGVTSRQDLFTIRVLSSIGQ